MTVDSENSTAVNRAIMTAAEQILTDLKRGNLFPCAPPDAFALIGNSYRAETDPPTGLQRQKEHCAIMAAHSTYPYPDDVRCVSQSSQVSYEEPNNNLIKIGSASSLTSSSLTSGEQSHGDGWVEGRVPPMHQVTFSSLGDGRGANKRGPLQDMVALEPAPQKPRLHESAHVPISVERRQPKDMFPEGGQQTPAPSTEQQCHLQDQQQGAQVPGQTTYQQAPPANEPSNDERPIDSALVHERAPYPQPQVHHHVHVSLHSTSEDEQCSGQTAAQSRHAHAGEAPSSGDHCSIAAGSRESGPALQPLEDVTKIETATTLCAPTNSHDCIQKDYYGHFQGKEALVPASGQGPVTSAGSPDSKQKAHLQSFLGPFSPSRGRLPACHNQTNVAVHQQIVPAPQPSIHVITHYTHPPIQAKLSWHPLPSDPQAQNHSSYGNLYTQIQPRPPPSEASTSTYQTILPRIYPRTGPMPDHHEHRPNNKTPTPPPHQRPQEKQQPQDPPQFTFSCGMPNLPPASHIETSSIQLSHLNYQQHQAHATTQEEKVTVTLAEAHGSSSLTHHLAPHGFGTTLYQSNAMESVLREPTLLPTPTACKPTAVAPSSTPTGARPPPEVASSLRNQRMEATDCLLFAASLLQETPTLAAQHAAADDRPDSFVHHFHEAAARPHTIDQYHPSQKMSPTQYSAEESSSSPSPAPSTACVPNTVYLSSPQSADPARDQPRDMDVLCGRGGLINKHIGNIIYRRVVEHNKPFYQSVQKRHRILVSQSIVYTILNRGGRFLSEDSQKFTDEDGIETTVTLWKPVPTARAIQKTSQALRERVGHQLACSNKAESEVGKGDIIVRDASKAPV